MKKLFTSLTAGLLVFGAQSLFAQATTNTPPADAPAGRSGQTAEQRKDRQTAMKLIGLTRDDVQGLSREDRTAKIKEAADKYLAAEKAKKDAGTFTAEDQTNVDLVKKLIAPRKKPAAAPGT